MPVIAALAGRDRRRRHRGRADPRRTFATLTLLPLEELIQIGATVAIGVPIDTFVVRALLIPALTHRLGDRP